MAIFPVSKIYPHPLPWQGRVRNGLQPDWRSAGAVVSRSHFALAHCRKVVFQKTTRPGSTPQGLAGTTVPWRWYFRTGENVESGSTIELRAECMVLPGDTSATDPRFQIDLNGGAITSNVGRYPLVDGSPDFGQMQHIQIVATGLAPDTVYQARLDAIDYARVVSMTVYEVVKQGVNTTGTYVSDRRTYGTDLPVTDAQHQEYLQDLHTIWKHNGCHLFSLVPDDVASRWTRTTATYVNILDATASTTVSSSTPGFNFASQYHSPFHTNNVACVFAVFADDPTGGDNSASVKLADSGGDLVELSGFSSGGEWLTAAFNLTGTGDHKVDVQFKGDGTDAFVVHSVCAYVYVT